MYEYNATVTYWVSGDTCDVDIDLGFGIVLRDQRVKLQGLITPEINTKDETEKRNGQMALNYCKTRIKEDSKCRIKTFKNDKVKSSTMQAELFFEYKANDSAKAKDWVSLNETLVKEGFAVSE